MSSINLRSDPVDFTNRDLSEVADIFRKYNFFCKKYDWNQEFSNEEGDFKNDFQDNDDGTVTDRATRLMWQKGHSPEYGRWEDAKLYIEKLNQERFAGYSDWRLPTIEELASIITREKLNDGLYISPVFSNRLWIWSCDVKDANAGLIWNSNFLYGSVYWIDADNGQDIRAVRTAVVPPGRQFYQDHVAYLGRGGCDSV
ncbi:MAG: DUF1566 domain-containing protein [Microcystis aeruginosa K13-06]|nr:DUF1566 domain-containing protein [Microcystis aeruginosa K13-06]